MEVYDNGGRTFDRYTVILENEVYTMSEHPLSPEGVNLYAGELGETHEDRGTRVLFEDLPSEVQEAIRQRQAWGPKVEVVDDPEA